MGISQFGQAKLKFVEASDRLPFLATASLHLCLVPFTHSILTMAAADGEEIRANAYVGFDTITQQIEHKLLKRGFQFNVIVVGEWEQKLSLFRRKKSGC